VKDITFHEVKKMKGLKGWPFNLFGYPWVDPCGEGDGNGGFPG